MGKPLTADGYSRGDLERARQTCVYVATKLGAFMNDLIVAGGLAAPLLVEGGSHERTREDHPGTKDLDMGLGLGLFNRERYRTFAEGLRAADFEPAVNAEGRKVLQTWKSRDGTGVTIDFLVAPESEGDRGGELRHLESDLAAVITPGLHLAFQDREGRTLTETFGEGGRAERKIWVCGPGAYLVLKSLAFGDRAENKDAFDLFYVLHWYGSGVKEVAGRLKPLMNDVATRAAMEILRRDFTQPESVGTAAAAMFVYGRKDEVLQADFSGDVRLLLEELK